MLQKEIGPAYAKLKADGAYCGSSKDPSWNHEIHQHMCCGSKKAVYHRSGCQSRSSDLSDVQEVVKTPTPIESQINDLRNRGYNSAEVCQLLNLTLEEVNKIWANHELAEEYDEKLASSLITA